MRVSILHGSQDKYSMTEEDEVKQHHVMNIHFPSKQLKAQSLVSAKLVLEYPARFLPFF